MIFIHAKKLHVKKYQNKVKGQMINQEVYLTNKELISTIKKDS